MTLTAPALFEFFLIAALALIAAVWSIEQLRLISRARMAKRRERCPACGKRHRCEPQVLRIKCRRCGLLFEAPNL